MSKSKEQKQLTALRYWEKERSTPTGRVTRRTYINDQIATLTRKLTQSGKHKSGMCVLCNRQFIKSQDHDKVCEICKDYFSDVSFTIREFSDLVGKVGSSMLLAANSTDKLNNVFRSIS